MESVALALPPNVSVAPDLEGISQAAAEFWVRSAGQATGRRGRFTVALAGGSTPGRLYELLGEQPWRSRVDWSKWYVFWGDERLVAPTDPNSNFLLAQEKLLARVSIPAVQIYRAPTELGDPDLAAARYEQVIRDVLGPRAGEVPRFDLILQGLGRDGHTASLFPGFPSLEEQGRLVVGSPPGALPPAVPRVTFTLPLINAARAVVFLAAGVDKAEVLRRVLDGDLALPAARVRPADGRVQWFVDAAAASGLG
ncbi:MAG: 6-phosphogluconolactonase [Chloroflexi bacterium]|nr:6-phosphogluconolactonase [Chloroflexota bacterium]